MAAGMARQVFAVPSGRAFSIVRKRLEELGLSVDKTDATHQVILSRWKKMNQGAPAWLTSTTPEQAHGDPLPSMDPASRGPADTRSTKEELDSLFGFAPILARSRARNAPRRDDVGV